jgi:ubiquinone/menaquinone biosynthesis C-methylase UbiE
VGERQTRRAVEPDYDERPERFELARSVLRRYGPGRDVHERVAQRLLAEGATPVLDVGCGEGELARHLPDGSWYGLDNSAEMLRRAPEPALEGEATALPFRDASFGSVALLYVLYHLPDPTPALAEAHRVLRPGGLITVTAPLVWELHELPHDYFRYTAPGLEHLLTRAGFRSIVVEPRNDAFTTLAQLMTNVSWALGRAPDGLDERREQAAAMLRDLAGQIAELAPLDARHMLPLGFRAKAVRAA